MAMTAMAVQASPSDIHHLKEVFMAIDVNGDGVLSKGEVARFVKKFLQGNKSNKNLNHQDDIIE